jgi:NTE family protein
MKIGLALSGGGFRATVFHLGVLSRLAAEDLLKDVTHLSTVSGGSLCAGLVYHCNDYHWPSPDAFQSRVALRIAHLTTHDDLQGQFIRRILRSPGSIFQSRAADISYLMRALWGIEASLSDLPDPDPAKGEPYWHILATCYETGKQWYFGKAQMGDYLFGYTMKPDVPLSDALAASSAVPGLIGPFEMDVARFQWLRFENRQLAPFTPKFTRVHLWDGGVYDNLGLEPLTNYSGKTDSYEYLPDIDFLIVSDASGVPHEQAYGSGWVRVRRALRLLDIARDQVRSLRARATVAHFKKDQHPFPPGRYFQTDNSCAQMFRRAGRTPQEIETLCQGYFLPEKAHELANMATTLRRLSPTAFADLYRHGFEVADATLHAFDTSRFKLLGFHSEQHRFLDGQ